MNIREYEFDVGAETGTQPDPTTPTDPYDLLYLSFADARYGRLQRITASTGAPYAAVAGTPLAHGLTDPEDHGILFVSGSGGVTMTANPRIAVGTRIGQRLNIVGTSDTDTVTLATGNGIFLSSTVVLRNHSVLSVIWDGTLWVEAQDKGITQLTGDVTAGPGQGSQAATIANDAVTNAKAANMAQDTIKGRVTAGTGDPEDLTTAQVTAMLEVFTDVLQGLVPASGGGTTNFLRADGNWAAPPGGGGGSGLGGSGATDIKVAHFTATSAEDGMVILVDASGGDIIVTLPSAVNDEVYTVCEISDSSTHTNQVFVICEDAPTDTINGTSGADRITAGKGRAYIALDNVYYRIASQDIDSRVTENGIGLFGGGHAGASSNVVDEIDIAIDSNSTDFGDLSVALNGPCATGSDTRAIFAGGNGGANNVIDYFTFATAGNATDFGDLTVARGDSAGSGSVTRGIFAGGWTGAASNVIDYITIASTGNATDFGDLILTQRENMGAVQSTTRCVFGGGDNGATEQNDIQYITTASTGNGTDFGDLTNARYNVCGVGSSTRGVFCGGGFTTGDRNIFDYITIASTGNATDFGDLLVAKQSMGGASTQLRGVVAGGGTSGVDTNDMEYITIATTGNSTFFGDITVARDELAGCSNTHGGI